MRNDLLDSVARFKGETLQADDLSLIVARFRGREESPAGDAAGGEEQAPESVRRAG